MHQPPLIPKNPTPLDSDKINLIPLPSNDNSPLLISSLKTTIKKNQSDLSLLETSLTKKKINSVFIPLIPLLVAPTRTNLPDLSLLESSRINDDFLREFKISSRKQEKANLLHMLRSSKASKVESKPPIFQLVFFANLSQFIGNNVVLPKGGRNDLCLLILYYMICFFGEGKKFPKNQEIAISFLNKNDQTISYIFKTNDFLEALDKTRIKYPDLTLRLICRSFEKKLNEIASVLKFPTTYYMKLRKKYEIKEEEAPFAFTFNSGSSWLELNCFSLFLTMEQDKIDSLSSEQKRSSFKT